MVDVFKNRPSRTEYPANISVSEDANDQQVDMTGQEGDASVSSYQTPMGTMHDMSTEGGGGEGATPVAEDNAVVIKAEPVDHDAPAVVEESAKEESVKPKGRRGRKKKGAEEKSDESAGKIDKVMEEAAAVAAAAAVAEAETAAAIAIAVAGGETEGVGRRGEAVEEVTVVEAVVTVETGAKVTEEKGDVEAGAAGSVEESETVPATPTDVAKPPSEENNEQAAEGETESQQKQQQEKEQQQEDKQHQVEEQSQEQTESQQEAGQGQAGATVKIEGALASQTTDGETAALFTPNPLGHWSRANWEEFKSNLLEIRQLLMRMDATLILSHDDHEGDEKNAENKKLKDARIFIGNKYHLLLHLIEIHEALAPIRDVLETQLAEPNRESLDIGEDAIKELK
jgi:hypothetical protein